MAEKSLKVNAIFSFIKSFMNLAFPIITFPYASRILMPEGIGQVNFANSIVQYFILIAELGIASYAIREAAKVRENKQLFSKFAKEIFLINMTSTIVAYCLLLITLFFASSLGNYKVLILICSIKILFTTFGMDWIYAAKEEFRYITMRSVIFQLISLVYLFLFVRSSEDIVEYTLFGILSTTGSNICNIIHSRKFIDWGLKIKYEIKKHLKPIFILFGTSVAISIYTVLDSTMLGFMSGDESVGIYSAATKINKMLIMVITSLNTILLPRLSFYAETSLEKYKETVQKSFNYILLIAIPMVVGLCVLAEPITLIFCGNEFYPSISPMRIMNPILLLIPLGSFFSQQVFIPHRKDKYSFIPVVVGACVNVITNFLLIPHLQAVGAAIGTLVAEFVVTMIKFFLGVKILHSLWFLLKGTYQYIIAAVIMGGCVWGINLLSEISIIFLFTEIVAGMIIYSVILYVFRNEYMIKLLCDLKRKLKRS